MLRLDYTVEIYIHFIISKTMSHTGRPKKLPSQVKTHRVAVNLTIEQHAKLDRLCAALEITYTEYFRAFLAKDKR